MTELEEIKRILERSPSVSILKSRNRELILIFLLSIFEDMNANIPYDYLQNKLAIHLENIELEQDEESDVQFIDSYDVKAKKLIKTWTKLGFISNFNGDNGIEHYRLTNHTTKTLIWLEGLKKKDFVGAESKFKEVFNQLKKLVEFTNEDAQTRIEMLEEQKRAIENEINELKISGKPSTYKDFEIIPRFNTITTTAKELLSDFKEVEENFKEITKEIYLKHTDITLEKRAVLSYTFDAIDNIKESHQGKSFYAFWQFLIDKGLQAEWNRLINELYSNLEEKELVLDGEFLVGIKNHLFETGLQVYRANDKMATKVSTIIRERNSLDRENLKSLITEVKNLLVKSSRGFQRPDFSINIAGDVELNMPFERRLTIEKKKARIYNQRPKLATKNIEDSNQFEKVARKRPVDKRKLKNNIVEILKNNGQTTLGDVIKIKGGITQGLPEVFGYFSVLKNFKHTFNEEKNIPVLFNVENNKSINIPEIIITK